jgi:hypothetical protein
MLAVPKIARKLMPVAGNAQALAKCILSGYAVDNLGENLASFFSGF